MSLCDIDMDTQHLIYQLRLLVRDHQKSIDDKLKIYHLTYYEWLIIAYLVKHQPSRQHQLKSYLALDESQLTKIISRLERRGILHKTLHPEDKRVRVLRIAPKAQNFVTEVYRKLETYHRHLLTGLSAPEQEQLSVLLNKLHPCSNN